MESKTDDCGKQRVCYHQHTVFSNDGRREQDLRREKV